MSIWFASATAGLGLQMAQQKLEAARKDLAALQAAASRGGAGDDSSSQAEEASLQEKRTRLAGLEQRILDIEDHIYGPLSELVSAGLSLLDQDTRCMTKLTLPSCCCKIGNSGMGQRILDIKDHIYGTLSELVSAGSERSGQILLLHVGQAKPIWLLVFNK